MTPIKLVWHYPRTPSKHKVGAALGAPRAVSLPRSAADLLHCAEQKLFSPPLCPVFLTCKTRVEESMAPLQRKLGFWDVKNTL